MAVVDGPMIDGERQIIVYYLYPSKVSGIDVEMVIKSGYRKIMNFGHIKRRFKVVQLTKKCYYEQVKVPK